MEPVEGAKEDGTSFEEAYNRLEQTVQALEAGGLTLEEAIDLYEEGMRLTKLCNEKLDAAELRITQLQNTFEALMREERAEYDE